MSEISFRDAMEFCRQYNMVMCSKELYNEMKFQAAGYRVLKSQIEQIKEEQNDKQR